MLALLELMKEGQALGLDDALSDDTTVEASLRAIFVALVEKLQSEQEGTTPTYLFSLDSCEEYEQVLNCVKNDAFLKTLSTAPPKAKIAHLRLYSTEKGSHWHAIFAELDEDCQPIQIRLTDSRVTQGKGITAHIDMENNPYFLQENIKAKIGLEPSLSQPIFSSTCWIYALANLAALTVTGKVYQRKTSKSLGLELAEWIAPPETVVKPLPQNKINSHPFWQDISPPSNKAIEPEQTESLEKPEQLTEKPPEVINPAIPAVLLPVPSYQLPWLPLSLQLSGTGVLSLSTGMIITGACCAAFLPLSPTLGIALLAAGILLALAGIALIAGSCLLSRVADFKQQPALAELPPSNPCTL